MKRTLIRLVFVLPFLCASLANAQKAPSFDTVAKEQYIKTLKKRPTGNLPAEFDWRKTPPQDLADMFSGILKESYRIEEPYAVDMGFYNMPVNKQCNSFAYFTAKSVHSDEIPFKSSDYALRDIYIVIARARTDENITRSSVGFAGAAGSDLKTSRGSSFFKNENGKMHIPWDHHAIALFVVESLKDGNFYYMIPDPFLYNRGVGLQEWAERYHLATTYFKVVRFAQDPKLDKKRILKTQTTAAKVSRFIKELADIPNHELTIKR
jgi:hypothetical protein